MVGCCTSSLGYFLACNLTAYRSHLVRLSPYVACECELATRCDGPRLGLA